MFPQFHYYMQVKYKKFIVHNYLYLPIFAFILEVGSNGLVKLVFMLVLGGFSSTKVDLIVAAVAKSFPPPSYKI